MCIKFLINDYSSFLSDLYKCEINYDNIDFDCSESLFYHLSTGNTRIAQSNEDLFFLRYKSIKLKFQQNYDLAYKLINLQSYDIIAESLVRNDFWYRWNGWGLNNLGLILSKVKKEMELELKELYSENNII